MRTTKALISTLALLLLAAPVARAASPCQDGARMTVDGIVRNIVPAKIGTLLFIEIPSLDCNNIVVVMKDAGTCKPGSPIHGSGILSEHHEAHSYMGWSLSDALAQVGPGFSTSFACK
jgi:hypothetical protein